MNKERRKQLDLAMEMLSKVMGTFEDAKSIIETAQQEESDAYDNLTENLQASERGERMNEVSDELSNIASVIELDIADIIARIDDCKY